MTPLSNKSRLATLGILAAASLLAWRNAQRQQTADLDSLRLEADCRTAGLDPATIFASGPPAPAALLARKSARLASAAAPACDPHAAAAQLAAYALAERTTPVEDQARSTAMLEMLATVQPAQLEAICADLRANPALAQVGSCDGALSLLFSNVCGRKPSELLDLLEKDPAIFAGGIGGHSHVTTTTNDSLSYLAHGDAAAALDWVRSHSGEDGKPRFQPEDYVRGEILAGIARTDPAQALSLIGELGDKWSVQSIANAAKDPAEKTATLAAMRDYAAQLQDPAARQQAIDAFTTSLARSEINKGFAAGSAWITANLTPEETASLAGSLSDSALRSDRGQWLEWLGDKLPPAGLQQKTGEILRNWADYDYAAAATWLDTTAPGPAREAAILSFAPVAAAYQPAAAANWATTLPPGPARDSLLNTIYDKWRTSDPAAADQFAQQHP